MKTNRTKLTFLSALVGALSTATLVHAQGSAFTYQGRLNVSGATASGTYDFRYRLALDQFGNSYYGSSVLASGQVISNGLFTAMLDFGAGAFNGGSYWLEVDVRTNGAGGYIALSPLQPVTPAPYAIFSGTSSSAVNATTAATATSATTAATASAVGANGVNGVAIQNNAVTAQKIAGGQVVKSLNGVQDAVTLAAGNNVTLTTNGQTLTIAATGGQSWSLLGNSGTTPGTQFVGTTDNQALELRANGVRGLRVEPNSSAAPNVIGGAPGNYVAAGAVGATIAGGGATNYGGYANTNSVSGSFSTVGGGYGNGTLDSAQGATIGGGWGNTIQANSHSSTISGGTGNVIQNDNFAATVAGGYGNIIQAKGNYSFIGGGSGNTIQADGNSSYGSVIGGGHQCTIQSNAYNSVICGGDQNVIQTNASQSFIGGGVLNTVQAGSWLSFVGCGDQNTVTPGCPRSFIGGGSGNTIQAGRSVIGGGGNNTVSGSDSVVPGGYGNTASGDDSFAAGMGANAVNPNCFVWSDGGTTTSTGARQFVVRAGGGVTFYSVGPGSTGVQLPAGSGSWVSLSDRNSKEHFVPVDTKAVLQKVADMPLSTWNYTTQDKRIRHIGPMAQDFHAAFGVGEDERHIATVDEGGVALAAIQGLNIKLQEKDAEIQTLKGRLDKLERALSSSTGNR